MLDVHAVLYIPVLWYGNAAYDCHTDSGGCVTQLTKPQDSLSHQYIIEDRKENSTDSTHTLVRPRTTEPGQEAAGVNPFHSNNLF